MKIYGDTEILGKRTIIHLDPNPSSETPYSGWIERVVVGQDINAGVGLYLNSNGNWYRASATTLNTMPVTAIATQSVSSGEYCNMLRMGFFYNEDWSFENTQLFISSSGHITDVQPNGYGSYLQCVGYAINQHVGYFHFSPLLLEIG